MTKAELRALASVACSQHKVTRVAQGSRAYDEKQMRDMRVLTTTERRAYLAHEKAETRGAH